MKGTDVKSIARTIGLLAAVLTLGLAFAQDSDDHAHEHGDHEHHDEHGHDHAHDDDHDHDHEHGHSHDLDIEGARLIVSDAQSNVVRVLDAETGEVVGSFTVPGETGGTLAVTGSGQYAVVGHRDANRVSIIHSGLLSEDHGDHAHLLHTSPYVVATVNVGRQPTHLVTVDHRLLVFNDQDGSIAILDENFFGLSVAFDVIDVAQPDHGAPLLIGDFVLSGYYDTASVDAYDLSGNLLESAEGCPGLHGTVLVGDTGVFGCTDGVLLAELDGDHFHWHHVANPAGSPEGARVSTLYGSIGNLAIGNFGAGLALIDVSTETFATVELTAPLFGAVVTSGHVVALTTDGSLSLVHVHSDGSAEVEHSLAGVIPAGTDAGRPAIAAHGDYIFVTSPAAGEVVVVHIHDHELELEETFDVPGNPAGIRVLMIEGNFESH